LQKDMGYAKEKEKYSCPEAWEKEKEKREKR
jgi:hypothetical protein